MGIFDRTRSGQIVSPVGPPSGGGGGSGANTALSNLSAVSINADLIPIANVTQNLGASAKAWNQLLVAEIRDSANTVSILNDSRVLKNAASDTKIDWAGNALSLASANNAHISLNPNGTGKIAFNDASAGTTGHVWTSVDNFGRGGWAAAASGANTALSNLAGVTSISSDLIGNTGADWLIQTKDDAAAVTKNLTIISGSAVGSGAASGNLFLKTGQGDTVGGSITIQTGDNGISTSGDINIYSGNFGGGSGAINIATAGAASVSGNSLSFSATTNIFLGTSSIIALQSSPFVFKTFNRTSGVASQNISLESGTTVNGVSGNVILTSGNTSGSGNSGNVVLQTGTSSSGSRGSIVLDASSLDASLISKGIGVGVWIKYTVTHTALQAAALTNNIELFSLPTKGVIKNVIIKHTTAFAGTSITAYTVSVGIAASLAKYASAFDVFQATGAAVGQTSSVADFESFTGATSIKIAATSVGANLSASTAGSVEVYVLWNVLP